MQLNLGVSESDMKSNAAMLSGALANTMGLYNKTKKVQWGNSGKSFVELHDVFEDQYKALELAVDEVAKRINKLGTPSPSSMQEYLELNSLKDTSKKNPASKKLIEQLLIEHEAEGVTLRENIKKCGDSPDDLCHINLLTGLLKWHDMTALIIRKHLS
jgi:starvation-inducible DNA-binding protein